MTFSYIRKYLKSGEAAKTASMAGYVMRNDFDTRPAGSIVSSGTWASEYWIEFRERAGTRDGTDSYVFKFGENDQGQLFTEPPSGPLVLDVETLEALASDGWSIMPQADAEAARAGTGNRW